MLRSRNNDIKDLYFSCSRSPYNWELASDPYSDIRKKRFPILKDTYTSMEEYNNTIEPLFHIECKEELRSFNEKLNEKKINFKALAVNVDIKAFKSSDDSSSSFEKSSCYLKIVMPYYFLSGYDGMDFIQNKRKYRESRSSGEIKRNDLLYLAKISDDFKTIYFDTLMFYRKTDSVETDDSSNESSFSLDSSDSDDDDDDDDFIKTLRSLNLGDKITPDIKLNTFCMARMSSDKINELQYEIIRERGQWICIHIMSFGPIRKEYNTLKYLVENPSLPICKIITSGKIDKNNNKTTKYSGPEYDNITKIVTNYYKLNESQESALTKVKGRRVSLIHGPPGTGKTSVLVALIDRELQYNNLTGNESKILVCAPSNYACDEIIRRLEKEEEDKEYIKSFRYCADNDLDEHQLTKELNEANVIVCTLCSSGNNCIEKLGFGLLIIDEACQATELTTLIPFTYNISQVVLIGDPKQLPPTVKSGKLEKCNYGKSLFERIYKSSSGDLTFLNIQYRMHPDISRLANKAFYNSKIEDGNNVKSNKWIGEWCKKNKNFGPLVFYNVEGNTEQNKNSSISNEKEAQLVINCINELLHSNSNICFSKRISVITFYNAQVSLIKKKLREYYEDTLNDFLETIKLRSNNETLSFYDEEIDLESDPRFKKLLKKVNIFKNIQVNTVDSFQGQENDIVILSTVRSDGKIGFLRNANRVNVSLTRARNSLIIIGNIRTLFQNIHWNKIITDITINGSLKLDGEKYFNLPHYFPKNILPKDFFEDLKKIIEQEKQEELEEEQKRRDKIKKLQKINEYYQLESNFSKMRISNFFRTYGF